MQEKLISILVSEPYLLNRNEIDAAKTFEEIGLDSVDSATFLHSVEKSFEVTIPMEIASAFRTINDVVEYLNAVTVNRSADG